MPNICLSVLKQLETTVVFFSSRIDTNSYWVIGKKKKEYDAILIVMQKQSKKWKWANDMQIWRNHAYLLPVFSSFVSLSILDNFDDDDDDNAKRKKNA